MKLTFNLWMFFCPLAIGIFFIEVLGRSFWSGYAAAVFTVLALGASLYSLVQYWKRKGLRL